MLSVYDTCPTYVLKRGYPLGFPTQPYDITQTIWPLFTWPPFWLANQSSTSYQPIIVQTLIRPCPLQSAKTVVNAGLPSFWFYSMSRQHPHSIASSIDPLHQCEPTDMLAITAYSISYQYSNSSTSTCKVSSFFLPADFQTYSASPNPCVNSFFLALNFERILVMSEGWGYHPVKYPPLPRWDQSRGHPLLSYTAYSPHAMYLPRRPPHSPLRGHLHTPAIQHAS